jgi:hydrogenase nickel incorporation protein HypA/HybF
MHEMALCEGIRDIVEAQGRANGARAVTCVRLEIGRFSSVEKRALSFAFDVVMRGSIADGARLDMVDLQGSGTCLDCEVDVEIDDRLDPCPLCGGERIVAISGDELRVKELEVI